MNGFIQQDIFGILSSFFIRYFSDEIAQQLLDNDSSIEDKNNNLTPRESELIVMFSEGLTTKEIAGKLNVGQKTVLAHRDNIKRKLSIDNNAQLIRYAVQNYAK